MRDRLHRRGPRPVQRRHDPPPGGLHRLPAGRAEEGRHRPRRQLALLVRLSGRHPGPRLRLPDPQRRVREGVPAGAGGDAPRGHARTGLLRAVRERLHARRAGGDPADPPAQALRRRLAPRARRRPWRDGGAAERKARRDRRLRPGRPDRRLAAGPLRLRRQDLRGGARARRLPSAGHSRLPAPGRGGREGHQERHRHRGRDRHEQPRAGPRRAPPRRVRRRPRGDRHAALHEPRHPGRRAPRRAWRRRVPARRPARPGARPRGPAGRRRRRRQRGHGRRAHRPAPGRCQRHGRLPPRPRGDAGPRARDRGRRTRGRAVRLPRRAGRGDGRRRRVGSRPPLHEDGARGPRRFRASPPRADPRQRAHHRLRGRHRRDRHGARHARVRRRRPHRPQRHAASPIPPPSRPASRRHLRRGRRRHRPQRHHARRRRGPPRRVHDRSLAHGRHAVRLRRPPAGRRQAAGRGPPAHVLAPRRARRPTAPPTPRRATSTRSSRR